MRCSNYLQSRNSRVRRGVPEKHGKYDVILSKETGLLVQNIQVLENLFQHLSSLAHRNKITRLLFSDASCIFL